jgi:hypothetical protein
MKNHPDVPTYHTILILSQESSDSLILERASFKTPSGVRNQYRLSDGFNSDYLSLVQGNVLRDTNYFQLSKEELEQITMTLKRLLGYAI